jgi:hypothetical protein
MKCLHDRRWLQQRIFSQSFYPFQLIFNHPYLWYNYQDIAKSNKEIPVNFDGGRPSGLKGFLSIVVLCVLVAFMIHDTKKIGIRHRNIWIVSTALFFPTIFLYLIRRYQFIHEGPLSKRQIREILKRKRSRARRERAEKQRLTWEKQQRTKKRDNPQAYLEEKENIRRSREEMRQKLDAELQNQQQRHQKRIGLKS